MRYYKLEVLQPQTTKWVLIDELSNNNIGALHITCDTEETTANQASSSQVVIFNPSEALFNKSLIGWRMRLTAGLASELYFANRTQIGVILDSQIFQQLPNLSTETPTVAYKLQSLLIADANYTIKKGSTWENAIIKGCTLFGIKNYTILGELSTKTLNEELHFNTMQWRSFTNLLAKYNIAVLIKNNSFTFTYMKDYFSKNHKITWTDLIGQPVAVGVSGQVTGTNSYQISEIKLTCHARGDLSVGDTIELAISTGDASAIISQYYNVGTSLTWANKYSIISLHHVLASRDIGAESWCTTITAVLNPEVIV